jgi:hypothetical protein
LKTENEISLKISISPRDFRFIELLLPHQLKTWHGQVNEVLIVFDLHGYNDAGYQELIVRINEFIGELIVTYTKIRLITVDYSGEARRKVSDAYFNGKSVPDKTHRYGPYYSYFYGLYQTKFDYVLNMDSDMFFGGIDKNWISEAVGIMKSEPKVITCSPLPGPPTIDGRLLDQLGQTDASPLRKIYFDSFSTRLFFIHKRSFVDNLCPVPIEIVKWPLFFRSLLRLMPVYALPEDILTNIMRRKDLKRVDFLGSGEGIWSLHPPFRNEEFFIKLPDLIAR